MSMGLLRLEEGKIRPFMMLQLGRFRCLPQWGKLLNDSVINSATLKTGCHATAPH